jgi:hypothetical protein
MHSFSYEYIGSDWFWFCLPFIVQGQPRKFIFRIFIFAADFIRIYLKKSQIGLWLMFLCLDHPPRFSRKKVREYWKRPGTKAKRGTENLEEQGFPTPKVKSRTCYTPEQPQKYFGHINW